MPFMKIIEFVPALRRVAVRFGRAARPLMLNIDRAGIAGLAISATLILGALAGPLPPGMLGDGVHVLLLAAAALVLGRIIDLVHLLTGASPQRTPRARQRNDRRRGGRGSFGRNAVRQTRTEPESDRETA